MPVTGPLHEKLTVTSGEKVDVNILTIRVRCTTLEMFHAHLQTMQPCAFSAGHTTLVSPSGKPRLTQQYFSRARVRESKYNNLSPGHQDSTETPTGIPSCRVGQGVRTDEHHG